MMALCFGFCLLVLLMVCSAEHDPQGPFPRRRQFRPEHRHGLNPLQRFLRKSTHDSLELDILVTPGIDPCGMNDSKIVLKTGASYESQVIGHLTESMMFGLRGFDDFRQRIVGHHVGTRLAFKILEGSSQVTLIGKKPFQANFIMADLIIDVYSKLNMKNQQVSLSDSRLMRYKPRVLLQPSEPVFPHFMKPIATSFIKNTQACIKRHFIPTFETGLNRALSAKNISSIIENMQSQPAITHERYFQAIKAAAPKIVKQMKKLKLPNINLKLEHEVQRNFTAGRIMQISRPKLYFVNKDGQNGTYNLQIIIKDVVIFYKLEQQPVHTSFSNIQYFLQVKESKKNEVLKGKFFHFNTKPHRAHLPFPIIKEFNTKLTSVFVTFLQKHLLVMFKNAL